MALQQNAEPSVGTDGVDGLISRVAPFYARIAMNGLQHLRNH